MKKVCVFDVNETLLDLAALDEPFARAFGDAAVRREWFATLLSAAFVTTITGPYQDFGTLAGAALTTVASRHERTLADADRDTILGAMRSLPPHPDVAPALDRLAAAGFRLATLTNSTEAVAIAQLEHAGLAPRFERILSVDAVKRLKPAPEVYVMAASELGVPIEGMRLIAAHGWDVTGAMRAGAAAAFVARPGAALVPAAEPPDIIAPDLGAVADLMISAEGIDE